MSEEKKEHPMKGAFPKPPPPVNGELILGMVYRVWWMNNPPNKPLHVVCTSLGAAMDVIQLLVAHDLYLGSECGLDELTNMGGMEVFREGDWHEWYSKGGEDIMQYMEKGGMI